MIKYELIPTHCLGHYQEQSKNKIKDYQKIIKIGKCSKCALPELASKLESNKHICIEKSQQNSKNVGIYLINLNKNYDLAIHQIIEQSKSKNSDFCNTLMSSLCSLKNGRRDEMQEEIINSIHDKFTKINELKQEIESYKNLLAQSESYLNLLNSYSESKIKFQQNLNHFTHDNTAYINKVLKAFISTKLSSLINAPNHYINSDSPFKSNQEINKINKNSQNSSNSYEIINNKHIITNPASKQEKNENVKPVKLINCAICDKPFPQDRLEKCYYEKCNLYYCQKCYSYNKHQVRTPDYPCNFYTCSECGSDNLCIMDTVFCASCQFRICSKCFRKKHIEH